MRKRYGKTILVSALALSLGIWLTPTTALTETNGSYVHPKLGGADEGNPMGKGLGNAPAPKSEGSAKKAAPHKSEGSSKKGYGPGAHPHKKPEGSGGKKYSHGNGYSHGKSQYGKGYGHGKSHHGKGEGSGKKHGYKSGHHAGGSHGKHSGGHGGHGGHKRDPFKHILQFKDKLGLTDAQVDAIREKRFEFAKIRIKAGADHMIAHMELDKIVHSGKADATRMRQLADEITATKSAKIHAMVEAKIWLLNLLTDEQKKKVAHIHGGH